jgi:hypothetical protein
MGRQELQLVIKSTKEKDQNYYFFRLRCNNCSQLQNLENLMENVSKL